MPYFQKSSSQWLSVGIPNACDYVSRLFINHEMEEGVVLGKTRSSSDKLGSDVTLRLWIISNRNYEATKEQQPRLKLGDVLSELPGMCSLLHISGINQRLIMPQAFVRTLKNPNDLTCPSSRSFAPSPLATWCWRPGQHWKWIQEEKAGMPSCAFRMLRFFRHVCCRLEDF